eukprot:224159-Chlamydomonas_euryale.AAC.1
MEVKLGCSCCQAADLIMEVKLGCSSCQAAELSWKLRLVVAPVAHHELNLACSWSRFGRS